MKRILSAMGLATLCVWLAGCLESNENWTLNPDGSGKIAYDMKVSNPMAELGQLGEDFDPKDMARMTAREIIQKSEGIDAWGDVTYGMGEDKKVFFKAIAYFPDLDEVVIGDENMSGATSFEKLDDGNIKLSMKFSSASDEDSDGAPAESKPKLSEEEIASKVQEIKGGWQFMRAILEPLVSTIKSKSTLHVPGTILSVKGFEKESENSASYELGGEELMGAMDKVMTDEKSLAEMISKGVNPLALEGGGSPVDGKMLSKMLFGDETPEIVFKPTGPQFDYQAEVAKAKASPTAAFKELIAD